MPNVNLETGIAYGTVYLNTLAEWVFDEFLYQGTNESYAAALSEWQAENPNADEDEFSDYYEGEEENYTLEIEGMKLGLSWLGGAPLVWVFESPHTTHVRPCSPCVPGAGDLNSPDPDGMVCYTLPPEWFGTEN